MLFETRINVNPAPAIAPPPARRRSLRVPTEPLLFAVMLTLLTLGINGGPPRAEAAQDQAAAGKAFKAAEAVYAPAPTKAPATR